MRGVSLTLCRAAWHFRLLRHFLPSSVPPVPTVSSSPLLQPRASHGFLCPHQPGFFSKLAAMFRDLVFHSSRSGDLEVRASDGVSD